MVGITLTLVGVICRIDVNSTVPQLGRSANGHHTVQVVCPRLIHTFRVFISQAGQASDANGVSMKEVMSLLHEAEGLDIIECVDNIVMKGIRHVCRVWVPTY